MTFTDIDIPAVTTGGNKALIPRSCASKSCVSRCQHPNWAFFSDGLFWPIVPFFRKSYHINSLSRSLSLSSSLSRSAFRADQIGCRCLKSLCSCLVVCSRSIQSRRVSKLIQFKEMILMIPTAASGLFFFIPNLHRDVEALLPGRLTNSHRGRLQCGRT